MDARIEQMIDAAHGESPVFLEVLHRYDYRGDGVVLVVEGSDDAPFYERVARDRSMNPERKFETVAAGSKAACIAVFHRVDWSRHDRRRILFFVDRDYTDFVESLPRISGENVYVTDGYSIENGLIGEKTAIALSRLACTNNRLLSHEDEAVIVERYRESRDVAARLLLPITACQVVCLRDGHRFEAKAFVPVRYFTAEAGRFMWSESSTGEEWTVVVRQFLASNQLDAISDEVIQSMVDQIRESSCYEKAVRGKYRFQLFRLWLKSLEGLTLPSGVGMKSGSIVGALLANAMAVTPAPASLREFFDRNLSVSAVA